MPRPIRPEGCPATARATPAAAIQAHKAQVPQVPQVDRADRADMAFRMAECPAVECQSVGRNTAADLVVPAARSSLVPTAAAWVLAVLAVREVWDRAGLAALTITTTPGVARAKAR